jgi:hypothetical protein
MHRILWLGLVLIIMSIFAGCAVFTSPARKHMLESNTTYWFDYDASRRGALLVPQQNQQNLMICAEPSPDVALEILNKFKAALKVEKVDVSAETEIQEKVIQLAKRTQTIMFLRESLYRLCEMSLNFKLPPEKVQELYTNVINVAFKMADAELKNAEQSRIEAEIKLEKIKELSIQKYKDENKKIDLIIEYVKTADYKVDKKKLERLIPNTGLDDNWVKKYADHNIDVLRKALSSKYRTSVDALAENLH